MPKEKRTIKQLRNNFKKIYANLPLPIRKEVIAIIDNQPMSYFVCWLEIAGETKKGDEILKYLERLDLI